MIVSGNILYYLQQNQVIAKLPDITAAEIHDKGKADVFAKALAVIQVLWIITQIIIRAVSGLSVSQLELVVAFSVCTVTTYLFLIQKPQGVQIPMRPIVVDRRYRPWDLEKDWFPIRRLFLPGFSPDTLGTVFELLADRVPNDFVRALGNANNSQTPYALWTAMGGVILAPYMLVAGT